MTQWQLALKSGLYPHYISQFEAGRRNPRIENLRLLCEALDVSADWLLFGERE